MKRLHIVPHTHWDREWYMPFEHHRYRLVELFDDLLDMFQKNPDYKTFHMDGQVIPVLDYLEIKPHKREDILKLIRQDKIQIGPFYILQDEFLISAESNVRNIIYGLKESKKLGADPVMIGYFPDSFGNIAQAPQLLNGFDIKTAAFGRGMNEVGFNNEIVEQRGINKSEVNWESPEGSTVSCVMFANWYCNAWELPKDKNNAAQRFKEIFNNAEPLSHLDDILGMNGCDHTPLDKNLTSLIKQANDDQNEFKIIHSNFKDYLKIIENNKALYDTVKGEITGQLTTGEHLLINTASSRIDIKKMNYQAQRLLEKVVEPVYTLARVFSNFETKDYIDYSWKLLLENHPHDSICTCSVDEVHEEMISRFNKVLQSGEVIAKESLNALNKSLDASSLKGNGLLVFNGTQHKHSGVVEGYVDFDESLKVNDVEVFTLDGEPVPVNMNIERHVFTYTLPKDEFRQVKYVDRVHVEILAKNVSSFGYTTFDVVPLSEATNKSEYKSSRFDNNVIDIEIRENGSFLITDKLTKETTGPLNVYEYSADIGNEYNFVQSKNNKVITTENQQAKISAISSDNLKKTVYIKNVLKVPKGVENGHVLEEMTSIPIETELVLYHDAKGVRVNTTIDNNAENLRIRSLNAHNIKAKTVQAEGQFNVISRPIHPWEGWKNPENHHRHHGYFYINDDTNGLIISGRGLHEHEVMRNNSNQMALTLLRAVGELGDWGIFPTPKSQMKKQHSVEYYIEAFKTENLHKAQMRSQLFHDQPLVGFNITKSNGQTPLNYSLIETNDKRIETTAYKPSENQKRIIIRFYNKTVESIKVQFKTDENVKDVGITNLAETKYDKAILQDQTFTVNFKPKEIVTISIKI